jgi:hypothetical protein
MTITLGALMIPVFVSLLTIGILYAISFILAAEMERLDGASD